MMTNTATSNLIDLLLADHAEAEDVLQRMRTAPAADRAEVFCELTEALVRHEVAEEVVVYPRVRQIPGGDAIADAKIAEQQEAESTLVRLDDLDPASVEFLDEVTAFAGDALRHAASEETDVFPLLESAASPEELEQLGERYTSAKEAAPSHPHPHAPDTPPGNVIAGPVLALVDRIRDAASARR